MNFLNYFILDTPQFKALFTSELNILVSIFKRYNYELRFVGGFVRDLLLGNYRNDLNLATPANSGQIIFILHNENINYTYNIECDNIICIINSQKFKISSLKTEDVYGKIKYTDEWIKDFERRDFTINSMSLGLDGTLYDYFNGREDLNNGRVNFLGDVSIVLKENYIRILRYYRFFYTLSKNKHHNENVLNIINDSAIGLSYVSKDKLWKEIKKIIKCNNICEIIKGIIHILPFIGLPENPNIDELERVNICCSGFTVNPVVIIVSIINNCKEFNVFKERVNMIKEEIILGKLIILHRKKNINNDNILDWYRRIITSNEGTISSILEFMKYRNLSQFIEKIESHELPIFPLSVYSLMNIKLPKHCSYTIILKYVRRQWIKSNYTLTRNQLLELAKSRYIG